MKIGIFGDSFAYEKRNETLTWSEMLGEKHEVINYGSAGSNLYWSIKQFLQFKNNFDKIVFIVTLPGRLLIPDHVTSSIEVPIHIPNINTATTSLDAFQRDATREVITTCINYFKYLDDQTYNEYVHKLMYNDLLTYKNDNIVFIDSSFIANISTIEYESIGLTLEDEYNNNLTDVRNCHMSFSNNNLFARKIDEWIETGNFNLDYKNFDYRTDEIKKFIYEQNE